MVLNSALVGRVATASADLCQLIACNPERLSSDQVLELLCCLPLYHLRRLAVAIFSFFCFPVTTPDAHYYEFYRHNPSSSSSSDSDSDDYGYDSHSD